MSTALTTLEQLKELEATCLTSKDLLELYKDIVYSALNNYNGDCELYIRDLHFEDINHNPSKEDL